LRSGRRWRFGLRRRGLGGGGGLGRRGGLGGVGLRRGRFVLGGGLGLGGGLRRGAVAAQRLERVGFLDRRCGSLDRQAGGLELGQHVLGGQAGFLGDFVYAFLGHQVRRGILRAVVGSTRHAETLGRTLGGPARAARTPRRIRRRRAQGPLARGRKRP